MWRSVDSKRGSMSGNHESVTRYDQPFKTTHHVAPRFLRCRSPEMLRRQNTSEADFWDHYSLVATKIELETKAPRQLTCPADVKETKSLGIRDSWNKIHSVEVNKEKPFVLTLDTYCEQMETVYDKQPCRSCQRRFQAWFPYYVNYFKKN